MINSRLKIEVKIEKYLIQKVEKKSHTFYRIDLKTNKNQALFVDKRFKDFEHLHNQLKKSLELDPARHFVEFPNKHFYTASHKTFEYRRSCLDNYMKKLIEYYGENFPTELVKFLNLEELIEHENNLEASYENQENESTGVPCVGIKVITSKDIVHLHTLKSLRQDTVLRGVLEAFYF